MLMDGAGAWNGTATLLGSTEYSFVYTLGRR
jgi:hypothetical protein